MQQGWIKNNTKLDQYWGNAGVPAQSVGLIPIEAIQSLREKPQPGIVLIEDDPSAWVFTRTEHEPWSANYKE